MTPVTVEAYLLYFGLQHMLIIQAAVVVYLIQCSLRFAEIKPFNNNSFLMSQSA